MTAMMMHGRLSLDAMVWHHCIAMPMLISLMDSGVFDVSLSQLVSIISERSQDGVKNLRDQFGGAQVR